MYIARLEGNFHKRLADFGGFKQQLTKATKPQQNRISPSSQDNFPVRLLVKRGYLLVFEVDSQNGQQFFSILDGNLSF